MLTEVTMQAWRSTTVKDRWIAECISTVIFPETRRLKAMKWGKKTVGITMAEEWHRCIEQDPPVQCHLVNCATSVFHLPSSFADNLSQTECFRLVVYLLHMLCIEPNRQICMHCWKKSNDARKYPTMQVPPVPTIQGSSSDCHLAWLWGKRGSKLGHCLPPWSPSKVRIIKISSFRHQV